MNSMTDVQHLADTITLADDERQRCEVWTRVMGYHRPVASFNIGKKGEHPRTHLLPRRLRRFGRLASAPPKRPS